MIYELPPKRIFVFHGFVSIPLTYLSTATPPESSSVARRPKLAQRLADRLSAEILKIGLQEGASLGNEASLAERLRASRWTVREALTMLDREGQITIRRGRYGGIFVAAPSANAISTAIRSYLEFIRVSVAEIIQARRILDEATLQLAVERVTPSDVAALRASQDLESETEGMHAGFVQYERLLSAARSPVLETFVRAVGQLGQSAILRSTLSDGDLSEALRQVRIKRKAQIEAVIGGRVGEAWSIENEILAVTARMLESARELPAEDSASARLRALHLLTSARQFKRPELLMQEISSDIVARGWPVGSHLGTEAELLARYRVSRSAFREAVRSLEQIGVVEMRTGRYSGLKISSPNPETVISNSRRQFARSGVSGNYMCEAFLALGVAASGLAAARHAGGQYIEEPAGGDSAAYFNAIGDASGNSIIALLMRIISGSLLLAPELSGRSYVGPTSPQMKSLIEAIRSGDDAVARRSFLTIHPN